jgi:hypothetical protein
MMAGPAPHTQDSPCFNTVSEGSDIEVDGELKIAASISYHRVLARVPGVRDPNTWRGLREIFTPAVQTFTSGAAAFAGMLLRGRVGDIVPMTEYGDKPLNIRSGGGYGHESDSLMALIVERWEELSQAFGSRLASRFGDFGSDDGHLWDCPAPHLSASPAL